MPSHQKLTANVSAIGIDIGKSTFHLIDQDRRGKIVMRARLSRSQLIGMEAGAGAHRIARRLLELGHDVRLIPAQYVKPFLKGHKNDYRDAETIVEAAQRPTMSFVVVKTAEQCDLQALHRVRSRLIRLRTGVINQIRGLLLEGGVVIGQRTAPLRKALAVILADPPDIHRCVPLAEKLVL
jgi:transposase